MGTQHKVETQLARIKAWWETTGLTLIEAIDVFASGPHIGSDDPDDTDLWLDHLEQATIEIISDEEAQQEAHAPTPGTVTIQVGWVLSPRRWVRVTALGHLPEEVS